MASAFSKAKNFLASLVHRGLDKAIESNSPEYLKQVIRNLEEATTDAAEAVASARGELVVARQDVERTKAEIVKIGAAADRLLTDNNPKNDYQADPLESRQMDLETRLQLEEGVVKTGEATLTSVNAAWQTLKKKHQEMSTRLGELTALATAAKAKKAGASAIKDASEALGGIDGASIDNVERKIRKENAEADALLEQATGSMQDDPMQAVRDSEVADRVAARRARLAAQAAGAQAPKAAAGSTETI